MKVLFVDSSISGLADTHSKILNAVKEILISNEDVEEVTNGEEADAIIIQEKNSFKNFRYINYLKSDELISSYPEKTFTINTDDCATGLLKGLYTSLPRTRYNPKIYAIVPYSEFPNDQIFTNNHDKIIPTFLAGWRGNTKSNTLRPKMVRLLENRSDFCIQKTDSWLNHKLDEKDTYAKLILLSKFSICPAGWAPVSFRIYESMALGRCPVIIADNFVPPEGPNWKDFALFFPEKDLARLPFFLAKIEHLASDLGRRAFEAWQQHFSADKIYNYYARTLLSLMLTAKTSKGAELMRWKSLGLHWDNKWTVPQRLANKLVNATKQ